MKIVKQSAELIGLHTPVSYNGFSGEWDSNIEGQNPEKLIERSGRVCYKSEDKITSDSHIAFIDMIAKRQHESVIEHSCATFLIVCDRGVSHEIVRHRIASYSQESTRYCNYSKDKFGNEITVIEPPGLDEVSRGHWLNAVHVAEVVYQKMLEQKMAPQIARSVLPTCLKTEVVMTANFREWRHFLKLRTAPSAHPQMREVAKIIGEVLKKVAPTVFKEVTWESP